MDADLLMQEIYKIARRLGGMKIFNHNFPINNTEMQMMKEIVRVKEEGKRIISSDLAKALGVTRSAISQIVNKLEKEHLVERVPDEKDRKIAYIELSESALGVYDGLKRKISRVMSEVIRKMGEEKVRSFIEGASEFSKAVDEAVAEMGDADISGLEEKVLIARSRRGGAKAR